MTDLPRHRHDPRGVEREGLLGAGPDQRPARSRGGRGRAGAHRGRLELRPAGATSSTRRSRRAGRARRARVPVLTPRRRPPSELLRRPDAPSSVTGGNRAQPRKANVPFQVDPEGLARDGRAEDAVRRPRRRPGPITIHGTHERGEVRRADGRQDVRAAGRRARRNAKSGRRHVAQGDPLPLRGRHPGRRPARGELRARRPRGGQALHRLRHGPLPGQGVPARGGARDRRGGGGRARGARARSRRARRWCPTELGCSLAAAGAKSSASRDGAKT